MGKSKKARKGKIIKNKKRKSIKNICKLLTDSIVVEAAQITTHGVNYIGDPKLHVLHKLFWIANLCGMIVLIGFLTAPLYSRYMKSPTVVNVEMDYFNWNVSFPAITLCPIIEPNHNAVEELIMEFQNSSAEDVSGFIYTLSVAKLDNLDTLELVNFNFIPPESYGDIIAKLFRPMPRDALTTNTDAPIKHEVAMTEMGLCHVLNSNVAIYDIPKNWAKKNIPYKKNNIELTVFDGDFFTQIFDPDGLYKIYIHSPDEVATPATLCFSHMKNAFSTIDLLIWSTRTSDSIKELKPEHRGCRFLNEPINERDPIFSYNRCLKNCRVNLIKQICGCVPHFYKTLKSEKICSVKELRCVAGFKKEIMSLSFSEEIKRGNSEFPNLPSSARDCKCPNNCNEIIYLTDNEEVLSFDKDNTRFRIGVIKLPKVRFVREVLFTFYDILLRIGGVVNLCLGSSIISLIELVMFFLVKPFVLLSKQMIVACVGRLFRK